MALIDISTITQVNGGNAALPAGTNIDGGGVVYPNMADPLLGTDGANRQFVESLIPDATNIVYVKSEDDFGSLVTIRSNSYHNVTQSTVFVLTEPIDLTTGGIGTNVAGVSIVIVCFGKSNSTINRLRLNTPSAQPLFAIEDMQNNQLVLQNIHLFETASAATVFDIETDNNLGIFNEIFISNCEFQVTELGSVNYNGARGRFTIQNTNIVLPNVGITLNQIESIWLINNWISNTNGNPINVFTPTNGLESMFVAIGNRMVSNTVGSHLFNLQNTAILPSTPDVSTYIVHGNDVRVAGYFNPVGLTNKSPQVKATSNYLLQDSTYVAWATQIAVASYTQTMDTINIPQIIDTDPTGSTTNNWVIDSSNVEGFNVTVEAIAAGAINNGSPATNQSIVFEYIGPEPQVFRIRGYATLNGPVITHAIGLFINTGSGWDAFNNSYSFVDSGNQLPRDSESIRLLNPGDKITLGIVTTGNLAGTYIVSFPALMAHKI